MLGPDDKILTWHPTGRTGVFIAKQDYDLLCDFILSALMTQEITLKDLIDLGESQLALRIENISWTILSVKLDLEARGLITSVVKLVPYRMQFLKLRTRSLKKYNFTFKNPGFEL